MINLIKLDLTDVTFFIFSLISVQRENINLLTGADGDKPITLIKSKFSAGLEIFILNLRLNQRFFILNFFETVVDICRVKNLQYFLLLVINCKMAAGLGKCHQTFFGVGQNEAFFDVKSISAIYFV